MEDKCESTSDSSRSAAEEEEFGKFFEKLANLVPTVKCACDEPTLDEDEDVQHCIEILEKHNDQDNITNLDNNSKNIALNFNNSSGIYTNNTTNKIYLENNQTDKECLWHTRSIRSGRSCNAIKTCKNNRHRSAPYKVGSSASGRHHNNDVNEKQASHNGHNKCYSTSTEPVVDDRLELLTDVIEYIHNLKSLLQSAQSRTLDVATQLEAANSRLCPDQQELQILQQQCGKPPASDLNSCPQPARAVDRNFSLPSAPAVGQGTYQIPDNAPVDRAMELLEYKTGAITLTA